MDIIVFFIVFNSEFDDNFKFLDGTLQNFIPVGILQTLKCVEPLINALEHPVEADDKTHNLIYA